MKWEKEHQVKERKIKQLLIKPAEGVESIPIIEEKDFVLAAVSEELPNLDNLVGETVVDLLMEIRVFIANN